MFFNWHVNATNAETICQADRGHLAKITSDDQNNWLVDFTSGHAAPCIGLHCITDTDCFWSDGTPLSGYNNFDPSESFL